MNLEQYIEHHSGGKPMTFAQYERYIIGWRKSQSWHRDGMSLAQIAWCEDNWPNSRDGDVSFMHLCWDTARNKIASKLAGKPVGGKEASYILASGDKDNEAEKLATKYFYLGGLFAVHEVA